MNLFADYALPLTSWLQANPNWALFMTFIISLTESLAIIGSIVPGSVTMTAIGILAGSGVMRIDLTLVAAILGAVAGDSLSYALGYFYSEQLAEIWPFRKYPSWLIYGKEFFARHGGKSVLIGRFVGPLRSIIPVIAGIMHMKQWTFFIANFISAIGWAFLYIIPGFIIGIASHELSTESATRLFLLTLVSLAGIWLVSLVIKWILLKLNLFLNNKLHQFWVRLKTHPIFNKLFVFLTPQNEKNHYPTAALLLITILTFTSFLILVVLTINTHSLTTLNLSTHLFIQSFHSSLLSYFFIACTQLTSMLTVISLYLICSFWFLTHKNSRAFFYITSIILSSSAICLLLTHFIISPRPKGLVVTMEGASFPAFDLVIASSFYGFLLFYTNYKYTILTSTLRTFLLIVLSLSGLGAVYLGDYWLTDIIGAFLAGSTLCLIHYLFYRRRNFINKKSALSILIPLSVLTIILLSSSLSTYLNFKTLAKNHTPSYREYVLNMSDWWNQKQPVLPLYRLNRIGKRISLLNIQYLGTLDLLQSNLEKNGWKLHTESFFTKLLMKMGSSSTQVKLPLLAQLYENKPPLFIMTYKDSSSNIVLVMRIWESRYKIKGLSQPLWIGSVHFNAEENKQHSSVINNQFKNANPLTYILPSLKEFTVRRVKLSHNTIKTIGFNLVPYILLIKKPDIHTNSNTN